MSLESLRPSDAWRMNCGFMGTGEFRAIRPTSLFDVLPLQVSFNVEVSWYPAFADITADLGSSFVLYSVRPEEGSRGWTRLDFGPPNVVYITPEDLANHDDPPTMTATPAPITLVQVTQNTVINQTAMHEASSSSSVSVSDDPIEIIDEASRSVPFAIRVPEEIPFSHHPTGGLDQSEITRVQNRQRPIAVEEFDPQGMLPFELAMQFVREENMARLGGHFGTRPPRVLSRPRETSAAQIQDVDELPNETAIGSNHTVTVTPTRLAPPAVNSRPLTTNQPTPEPAAVPKPPSTPKPAPPPFPPSITSRSRMVSPATALTVRTISNLSSRYHPRLRAISYLRPELMSTPILTRTGLVNPPLPKAPETNTPTHGVASSSLRTTREGIRLEITPVAMVLQTQPENHIPVAEVESEHGRDATGAPIRPSTPELDPEQ